MRFLKKKTVARKTIEWDSAEAEFVGRLTADVSHELMNLLAVLRESSGLLEDLLHLDKDWMEGKYGKKFQRGLGTIGRQVARGIEIGEKLNAFAHRLNADRHEVDIHQLLTDTVFFLQRKAKTKRIDVACAPNPDPRAVAGNPFEVQLLLTSLLTTLMDGTSQGSRISVEVNDRQDGLAVSMRQDKPGKMSPRIWTKVQMRLGPILDRVGGRIDPLTDGKSHPGVQLILRDAGS